MNRRRFMQVAGIAGVAVMAPTFFGSRVRASGSKYQGPFFITVNAGGGWDPTISFDPKGGQPKDPKSINQWYTPDQIGKVGNIRYAPLVVTDAQNGMGGNEIFNMQKFLQAHGHRLRVLNGVDNQTNNHDAGTRTTWSGRLTEGYPSFAALAAAVATMGQTIPLAYISNGGYDATEGTVSLTRVGDPSALARIAHPNIINPGDQNPGTYLTPETASRIAAAQNSRLKSLQTKAHLPVYQQSMNELFLARQGDDGLGQLADEFASYKFDQAQDLPGLKNANNIGGVNDLMQQAQVALLAFKAGVAVSANIGLGGFDTHSNTDRDQNMAQAQILRGLDYLFTKLDAMGLAKSTYVMLGSDFGRTPFYNQGMGKDHWNVTTAVIAGPTIDGDRVVGGTTDDFKAKTWNLSGAEDPNGQSITTANLHVKLRQLINLDKTELAAQFPIAADDMGFLFKG